MNATTPTLLHLLIPAARPPYGNKDLHKAANANKFIGHGSPASSTERYRIAAAHLGNYGTYSTADAVFVSVEGNRPGRLKFDKTEIDLAIAAQACFITDTHYHRHRPYNIGEREIATYLRQNNYYEFQSGFWMPIHKP